MLRTLSALASTVTPAPERTRYHVKSLNRKSSEYGSRTHVLSSSVSAVDHDLLSSCPSPKLLSSLNAFEISNLQEQETESRYPGDQDVTMLHAAEKLLNGVFADHTSV